MIMAKVWVFNATFNSISVISCLSVDGENRSARKQTTVCRKSLASITLYLVHLAISEILTHNFIDDTR